MGKYTRAELTPFRPILHNITPHIWTPLIKSFHLSIYMWGAICDLCVEVTSLASLTTQVAHCSFTCDVGLEGGVLKEPLSHVQTSAVGGDGALGDLLCLDFIALGLQGTDRPARAWTPLEHRRVRATAGNP